MVKKKIEFTDVEADKLISMMDMLVRDRGLKLANDCLFFTQKVQSAFVTKKSK